MIVNVYEPYPRDNRQSFYGKCSVYENERGEKALRSYETIVMTKDRFGKLHRHWDGWSMTTARHIWSAFGIRTKEYNGMDVESLPRKWRSLQETF